MFRKMQRRKQTKINRNPLRKIVDHTEDGLELLECGHKQRPRSDFVGHTNSVRRRCRQCGKLAAEQREKEVGK